MMAHKTQSEIAQLYQRLAYGEDEAGPAANIGDWLKSAFVVREGYQKMAAVWMRTIIFTIIAAFAAILWAVQSSLPETSGEYSSAEEPGGLFLILIKALLVLIPLLFLLRFATRSYRINKHLEVIYTHRWILHESINNYLETAGPNVDREAFIKEILPFFYNDIETGYITKKDGLGDRQIDTLPPALVKALSRR